MRQKSDGHHPEINSALDHLLSSGGKRIRPTITLLTGKMLGGSIEKLIILSAAIELLHTATLVHDDLIDGALLRRGIATLNAQWSPAATVLTGDYIFAKAASLAAETESSELIKIFSNTLATIVNGEITQLFANRGVVNREEYYRRIYAKTASLFELSAMAAAMLSPVSKETILSFKQFGYDIGMAFQIIDDILDFTGEQTTIGKPVASDLRQGIITLPAIYYFENSKDHSILEAFANGNYPLESEMENLIHLIKNSDSISSALSEAKSFVIHAREIFADQPDCIEKTALENLTNYIVDRNF
ncbi:MAG: polyprenyl synthetase family protein [Chloroflexi bacterium]|nr:polyprenyl synthetase family protein [Chloroflexota bacterium]